MKRPYSETLFQMLPLPTLSQWEKMTVETRLELFHDREKDFKAAGFCIENGVVAFAGCSALALNKGYRLSRNNARTLEGVLRFGHGVSFWSDETKLRMAEVEIARWLKRHKDMPMNVLKAKFKADTVAAVAAHFSPAAKAQREERRMHEFAMQTDSSYAWEFTRACARGEFDAVEAQYPVSFSEEHKREFERLMDKYDSLCEA